MKKKRIKMFSIQILIHHRLTVKVFPIIIKNYLQQPKAITCIRVFACYINSLSKLLQKYERNRLCLL